MFSFKNLKNKGNLISFIVSIVTFVWVMIALVLMSTSPLYISYDSTLAVRYIFIIVVGIIFALGCLRFALGALQTRKEGSALKQGFIFFLVAELLVSGIAGLTILEDYSISMRLLEDALYVFARIVIIFISLFALTLKDRKKLIIVSSIVIGISVFVTIFDLSVFALSDFSVVGVDEGERTLRDVDFMYVWSSLGLAIPYVCALIYSLFIIKDEQKSEEERVTITIGN